MHVAATFLTVALSLFHLPQSQPKLTGNVTLTALRDRARPLLIFAPSPSDPQLQLQLRILHAEEASVTERDILVIAIPNTGPAPTPIALSPEDAAAARHRFNITPTIFAVILIGKDGGEKLRSSKPLTIQQLRDTIDAMPMRQHEMHRPY